LFAALAELARVLLLLPSVELGRVTEGPGPLVQRLRERGLRARRRTESEQARFKQTISRIDAHLPDGGNCYRRSLLRIALDPAAAKETFFLGLNAACAPMSGHAWLASDTDAQQSYDVVITL
jgi:hypothetical protein